MPGDLKGRELLSMWCGETADRMRYLSDSDPTCIQTIRKGVLFVISFYSVPACWMFVLVTKTLAERDPDRTLEFVVLDNDGIRGFHDLPEFKNRLHASGETACICNGKIMSTTLGLDIRNFTANLNKLMVHCNACV